MAMALSLLNDDGLQLQNRQEGAGEKKIHNLPGFNFFTMRLSSRIYFQCNLGRVLSIPQKKKHLRNFSGLICLGIIPIMWQARTFDSPIFPPFIRFT